MQALALVWFDFDALAPARGRPIKTWNRAKRLVTKFTNDVVAATTSFLASRAADSVANGAGGAADGSSASVSSSRSSSSGVVEEYSAVLKKLGVA